jgi:methionyl aminopeptidase
MLTKIKTDNEIAAMRSGGKILSDTLTYLAKYVKPGTTTGEISKMANKKVRSQGGSPAFFGYHGFPEPICISVNDEVVHGIPRRSRVLHDGDVVSLDLGVSYKGMIVDGATTIICGKSNPEIERLLKGTKQSLEGGTHCIRDGVKTGDIGSEIEKTLTAFNLGIVRDLVGHGVGHEVHEDPNIPNYGRKNTGSILRAGMTIAVEPMATLGKDGVYTDVDGWTIKTKDGSLAAHFEHTILITQDGAEILTA